MLTQMRVCLIGSLACVLFVAGVASAEVRSSGHQEYAAKIWRFVQSQSYRDWTVAGDKFKLDFGPPCQAGAKTYLNGTAATNPSDLPYGSLVVTEHLTDGEEAPMAVTIVYRVKKGYNAESNDCYWAHYLTDGTVVKTVADNCPLSKRGFAAIVDDGRSRHGHDRRLSAGRQRLTGENPKSEARNPKQIQNSKH